MGQGDLRPYVVIQFGSIVAILGLAALRRGRLRATRPCSRSAAGISPQVCEHYDGAIYAVGGLVSGHSIKHILAGMAVYWVLHTLRRRQATAAGATH